MSFWNKIRSILTAVIGGTEVALFAVEAAPAWKWFTFLSGLVIIFITHVIEDKNNNNIADIFEDDQSNHMDGL